MFLRSLTDKQKELYMKLAIKAAEANGIIASEERNMIKAYGLEMDITPFYSTDAETSDIIEEIISVSDEKARRIIAFEILGIMISDNEFDEEERVFVDNLIEAFKMPAQQKDEMLDLLYSYLELYNKISNLVLGE